MALKALHAPLLAGRLAPDGSRVKPYRLPGALKIWKLLWSFHNTASGKCFPSYEAIAERASCARSTVAEAIRALERIGILTWKNRLKRVREYVPGLFGKASAWCGVPLCRLKGGVLQSSARATRDYDRFQCLPGLRERILLHSENTFLAVRG
jgi:hypothetical protein